MKHPLIGLLLVAVGAAFGAGGFWLLRDGGAAEAPPAAEHAPAEADAGHAARTADGEVLIQLDAEAQQRAGIEVSPLQAASMAPETVAYGVLQEDPEQAFVLRAPAAGVLAPDSPWPALAARVAEGTVVGRLLPRLTPAERIDLATRLAQARADAAEAEASLSSARASYESKKKLNEQSQAVSTRTLEDAEAKLKSETARVEAARSIVSLIEAAQSGAPDPAVSLELRTARGGEVVEVSAQPGEAVEAGQALLRVVDFRTMLARVEVPAGVPFDAHADTARLTPVGQDDAPLSGRIVGIGAAASSAERGTIVLIRITDLPGELRPGVPVVAHLTAPGGVHAGVIVPREAIVRFQGRQWAYVRAGEEQFVRRELPAALPAEAGWFVSAGFTPGESVVTTGAQVLLSEEQKQQIEQENAALESGG